MVKETAQRAWGERASSHARCLEQGLGAASAAWRRQAAFPWVAFPQRGLIHEPLGGLSPLPHEELESAPLSYICVFPVIGFHQQDVVEES